MAAENIFAQYVQPVRSVQDRIAALDEQDYRREALGMQREQNRLALLAGQRQEAQYQKGLQRENAIQSLITGAPDEETAANRLFQAGYTDAADKIRNAALTRRKSAAEAAKAEQENTTGAYDFDRKKADDAIRSVLMFDSPAHALKSLQQQVADGLVPADRGQMMAQMIQTDPQWQIKMLRGLIQAKDRLELADKEAARAQQGQQFTAQQAQALQVAQMQDKTTQRGQDVGAATTRRGQDLTAQDAAARRAAEAAKAAANPTAPQAKVADAQEAIALLNDAEKSIGKATGSYTGAGLDTLAQAVGISTQGAQHAAKLKAIEGLLVSKMPKMSGPQSDKDVALYRQMAGMIGDPTIPPDTKTAAVQTIRDIQERYAGMPAGSSRPTSGPKPGAVEGGYRFKGGDPADPKNWEKQ